MDTLFSFFTCVVQTRENFITRNKKSQATETDIQREIKQVKWSLSDVYLRFNDFFSDSYFEIFSVCSSVIYLYILNTLLIIQKYSAYFLNVIDKTWFPRPNLDHDDN
jgi:hypothetical protein